MTRPVSILVFILAATLSTAAAEWHLSLENATKMELTDVSVSWEKHKITAGILGYNPGFRVHKTHLFVSDVVGRRVPTNAVVRYTTPDKMKHEVKVDVPKTVVIGSKETLVFAIADDEKVSVRKDK